MEDFKLANIVNVHGKSYLIDTAYVPFTGYETMVFKSRKQPETDDFNSIDYDKVSNWGEIYADHYENEAEATEGHKRIVGSLARILDVKAEIAALALHKFGKLVFEGTTA